MKVNELIKKLDHLKEQLQKVPGDTIINVGERDEDKDYYLGVKFKEYYEPTNSVERMSESDYDYFIANRAEFPEDIELLLLENNHRGEDN